MCGEVYFIYVLQLANGGYYVGSTKNLAVRINTHIRYGGATATKEFKPTGILKIFSLVDYKIGSYDAHLIAEVLVASKYANLYGIHMVRGAKHGKGWNDAPSPNGLKLIQQFKKFAKTTCGNELRSRIMKIEVNEIENSFHHKK